MRLLRWPAWRPGWRSARGAQALGQLATQRAARLHVERLIDRLGRHPHLRVGGELAPQAPGDLLGRVAPPQIILHELAQRHVDGQPGRLGAARALVGQRVCRRRPVTAAAVGVATQLARDRRRCAPQSPRDHPDRLAAGPAQRDLLTLGKRQAAALQVASAAGAHAATRSHPARALLAIRAHLGGRIGDELAALQRSPERLDRLGDLRVGEPDHRHPRPLVAGCASHRTPTSRGNPAPRTPSGASDGPQRARLHRHVAITARTQGSLSGSRTIGWRCLLAAPRPDRHNPVRFLQDAAVIAA